MSSIHIATLMTCVVSSLATPTPTAIKLRDSGDLFQEMCQVLVEEPSFNLDKLYDIWLNDFCWNTREVPFDLLAFIKATSEDVRKFKRDMGKLLVTQPAWNTATSIMVSQQQRRKHYRVMLFPDKGMPGRFLGVPNFRDYNPVAFIKKKSVFLVRLQMLMLDNSSYLIILDCDTGEASLSHRDTLAPIFSHLVYMAALRVPFPVRYSHLYTGVVIPDIPADHPPEPLFV